MILYSIPYDTRSDGVFDCLSMPASAYPIYGWAPGNNFGIKTPPVAGIRVKCPSSYNGFRWEGIQTPDIWLYRYTMIIQL